MPITMTDKAKPTNKPMPFEDGITHINIYSGGATLIGRLCSNMTKMEMMIPGHGHFASMEGYYYWVSTGMKNHVLRSLYGYRAKEVGRTFERAKNHNFEEIMLRALWYKVTYHSILRDGLLSSDLPFVHYYIRNSGQANEFVIVPEGNNWLVDGFTALREALKNNAFSNPPSIEDFLVVYNRITKGDAVTVIR